MERTSVLSNHCKVELREQGEVLMWYLFLLPDIAPFQEPVHQQNSCCALWTEAACAQVGRETIAVLMTACLTGVPPDRHF